MERVFALFFLASVARRIAAIPCVIGQEPDPATGNSYRWVIPVKDPCQCTRIRVGGRTSTQALCRPFPVTYYDSFFESDDPAEIRRLLNCSDAASCPPGEPLGMEDGRIPDENLSASSVWQDNIGHCGPQKGRLNFVESKAKCWCAKNDDKEPWIQVGFGRQVCITGVILQGRADYREWVTRYRVNYSDDGENWDHVSNPNGSTAEFLGNVDQNTHVTTHFAKYLYASFLRILPTAWHGQCRLRFEVLGNWN